MDVPDEVYLSYCLPQIACMQNILSAVKPDLNDCVALPKDFKKEKPDAKRADYPVLTGYTALHFGKVSHVNLIHRQHLY